VIYTSLPPLYVPLYLYFFLSLSLFFILTQVPPTNMCISLSLFTRTLVSDIHVNTSTETVTTTTTSAGGKPERRRSSASFKEEVLADAAKADDSKSKVSSAAPTSRSKPTSSSSSSRRASLGSHGTKVNHSHICLYLSLSL
jgi:hypothetical protein